VRKKGNANVLAHLDLKAKTLAFPITGSVSTLTIVDATFPRFEQSIPKAPSQPVQCPPMNPLLVARMAAACVALAPDARYPVFQFTATDLNGAVLVTFPHHPGARGVIMPCRV